MYFYVLYNYSGVARIVFRRPIRTRAI